MLKNIKSLTSVFIKSNFKNLFNTGNKKKTITRVILYVLLFVYLIGVLTFISNEILNFLIPLGIGSVFIGYILTASFFLVLVTSIISSISINYFSSDNLSILPLPLKPMEVLASKVNTLLAYEYIETMIIGIAPLIVYGVRTNQEFIYYIFALLVLLLIPIIPTILGSFVIMLIMSLTKGIRNKNIVQIFTMVLSIAFAMSISLISSNVSTGQNAQAMMMHANAFVDLFRKYFFSIGLGIDVLIEKKVLSLILLLLASIAFYVLLVLFGQKLYYRGMLGSLFSSSGISNKKINEKTAFKSRGLFFSYIAKEIKTYIRKPVYLVQLVLPCIIMPILMLIIFLVSFNQGYRGDIRDLLPMVYMNREFDRYIFAALLLVTLFLTMYSFISIVAISKDGKDASFMKYIPVPFYNQVIYKMMPDILMVLFSYLVLSVALVILIGLPIKYILYSTIVMIPYSITHGAIILLDLAKPKLVWNNEMQVVKSNFRIFYSIAYALLSIIIVVLLAFYFRLEILPLTLILTSFYLVLSLIFFYYIYKKDIKLAKNIS